MTPVKPTISIRFPVPVADHARFRVLAAENGATVGIYARQLVEDAVKRRFPDDKQAGSKPDS
jgi:hypothetical protein